MTDAQKEAAARELCRLRGIDPERIVGSNLDLSEEGCAEAVLVLVPAWRQALKEIEAQEQLEAAIAFGRNSKEP